MASALEIAKQLFGGGHHVPWIDQGPTMKVEAELEVGRGLTAEVCKLEVELLSDRNGVQDFVCRLTVDRGDGTVGIHRRSLTGFDSNTYNAVALLSQAFHQFIDVSEKE